MNKHLFNIIIFLLTPILSFSQAKDSVEFKTINNSYYKKVYIGISGGLSYPMGSFSSKNTEFDNSAYAKRGSNINLLDFGYRIGKTLGVGAYYFNSSHEVDLDALIRNQNTIGTVRYLNGSADNYEIKGLMLGLFVSKKDDIIDLDLRFMGGSANIFLPQMTLNYRDLSQNEIFEELYEPISERSMGVGLSAGFRIHLNEYLDFMCHGNYLIFQNTFDRIVSNGTISNIEETKITYEIFNLNVGVAFRFINEKERSNGD